MFHEGIPPKSSTKACNPLVNQTSITMLQIEVKMLSRRNDSGRKLLLQGQYVLTKQMDIVYEYITYRPSIRTRSSKNFSFTDPQVLLDKVTELCNSSVAFLIYPGLFLTLVGLVKYSLQFLAIH